MPAYKDTRKVVDFYITNHGIEHSQYFQGHGIALTKWEDCATGIGETEQEALDDALDSLAQNGWDVCALEDTADFKAARAQLLTEGIDRSEEDSDEGTEIWHHVSVDVRGES